MNSVDPRIPVATVNARAKATGRIIVVVRKTIVIAR
jgi:hypothetical protein